MFKIIDIGESGDCPEKKLAALGNNKILFCFGYWETVNEKYSSAKFFQKKEKQIKYLESQGFIPDGEIRVIHKNAPMETYGETMGWKGYFRKVKI